MRESERQKLKRLMEMGKSNQEILELMKPRRIGNNSHQVPDGGITYMEAERRYGIHHQTISRWVAKGYIDIILETRNEVYLNEAKLRDVIGIYLKSPGQGRYTLRHHFGDGQRKPN